MHRLLPLLLTLAAIPFPAQRAAGIEVFALGAGGDTNQLFHFDSATPAISIGSGLNGLVTGDTLVAIDVRPASSGILALAVNGSVTRLYRIDVSTSTAIPIAFDVVVGLSGAAGEVFGILSGSDRLVRNGGAAHGFAALEDVPSASTPAATQPSTSRARPSRASRSSRSEG